MKINQKLHTLSPASIILIMLLTGCYHTSESAQPSQPGNPAVTTPPAAITDSTTMLPNAEPAVEKEPLPAPSQAAVSTSDKVSSASADSAAKPEPPTAEVKPAPTKSKIDIHDPYNQAKPTLLGLSLNSSKEVVTTRYGKPKAQFMMDEDTDPITVYDYKDFLVGFNKKNQLTFIDIRSAEINPGLNGLQLGQSTGNVFSALGKPDSNTSFVLTYKSTGAILKLDIDPKTDKVNSIKLFTIE